jgi:hypothetical protein
MEVRINQVGWVRSSAFVVVSARHTREWPPRNSGMQAIPNLRCKVMLSARRGCGVAVFFDCAGWG